MLSGWQQPSYLVSDDSKWDLVGFMCVIELTCKLKGSWEFVRKGDPPVMGLTPLAAGITEASLRRPRRKLAGEQTAQRLPGSK